MIELSKVRAKIRLPSREIGTFEELHSLGIDGYLAEFKENFGKVLAPFVAPYPELEPMDVEIRTDVDEYYLRYRVHASLMETDEQFVYRMKQLDVIAENEARLVEEAKIIKSLAYDEELGEYIRLREKFKLYEPLEKL